jgi:hypothetical protein
MTLLVWINSSNSRRSFGHGHAGAAIIAGGWWIFQQQAMSDYHVGPTRLWDELAPKELANGMIYHWFCHGFTMLYHIVYIYILYHIIQRGSPKSPLVTPGATWSHHTCKRHAIAPFHGFTGEHQRSRPVTVIYCSHLPTAVATSVDMMTRLTIDIRNSDVSELHFKHKKNIVNQLTSNIQ